MLASLSIAACSKYMTREFITGNSGLSHVLVLVNTRIHKVAVTNPNNGH